MNLDLQRLNSGEQIAAGGALALFVCMFFSWFNFGFDSVSAWDALHYISPILTVVVVYTVGVAAITALGKELGDLPGGMGIFVLGCVATVLIFIRLIDPVSLGGSEGLEATSSVEAGLFLGLIAAAAIAVGGYLATGGTALSQVKALLPSQPRPAPQPPPPPPAEGAAFCEQCGTRIGPEDRFCSACGAERAAGAQT